MTPPSVSKIVYITGVSNTRMLPKKIIRYLKTCAKSKDRNILIDDNFDLGYTLQRHLIESNYPHTKILLPYSGELPLINDGEFKSQRVEKNLLEWKVKHSDYIIIICEHSRKKELKPILRILKKYEKKAKIIDILC